MNLYGQTDHLHQAWWRGFDVGAGVMALVILTALIAMRIFG